MERDLLRTRRLAQVVAGLACVSGAALSCAQLLGANFDDPSLAPQPDATSGDAAEAGDAGAQADASDATSCSIEALPPRPVGRDGGAPTVVVVAMYSIDFGEPLSGGCQALPRTGVDLDGLCTGTACGAPCFAIDKKNEGPGGIDNAFARVVCSIANTVGIPLSDTFTSTVQAGHSTIIFQVRGWNGLPDDDAVNLSWYFPHDFTGTPKWDGLDPWQVPYDDAGDDEGGAPYPSPYFTDTAYVSGGRLVANLSDVVFGIPGATATAVTSGMIVHARGVRLTATIVQRDAGLQLEQGTFAGWITTKDFFDHLAEEDIFGNVFCVGGAPYANIAPVICRAIDGTATGDAAATCEAMSFAASFETRPVVVVGYLDRTPPRRYCVDDAGNDDADPKYTRCEATCADR